MGQSCAHARIECGNPVPTPGLTAGRVSGEKTLRQRYCEDSIADGPSALARQWGFRDETQLRKRCAPHRIASGGFFGQNRKLKRSRKTDLGVERSRNPDLGKKNPDLGAGSDAGQVARPGFYAGQLGPRSHWQKKLQVLPPHDNLDILRRTGFYFFLVCRAGWAMPGRFAETLDSGPQDNWKTFSQRLSA